MLKIGILVNHNYERIHSKNRCSRWSQTITISEQSVNDLQFYYWQVDSNVAGFAIAARLGGNNQSTVNPFLSQISMKNDLAKKKKKRRFWSFNEISSDVENNDWLLDFSFVWDEELLLWFLNKTRLNERLSKLRSCDWFIHLWYWFEPWWWHSGQCRCLQLQRSEFESWWLLITN